jgi:hypothetical protein
MDFLRPITSRHVLAAATAGLVVAAFGGACAAQDERGAMSQGAYQGPYLTWSGKQATVPAAAPASAAQEDAADLTEARYAPAPNYTPSGAGAPVSRYASQGSDASSSDVSESRYATARYVAPQPQDAPPPERQPAVEAFAPPPAPAPIAAPAPEPVAAPAPQPAAAYAQPSAAPIQPAQAQPAEGTTGVHFYSLHRAYGMSPDPIPAPTEGHTVLIAAPDNGTAAQGDGQGGDQDQDGAGDGDGKPAAHGDGSGGDSQSGDN